MQLSSQKQADISTNTSKSSKLIDLYIRNGKKEAIIIHTTQNTNISHLNNTISSRFGVPITAQILFYNGERLSQSDSHSRLNVEDKTIVHLVDRRNIKQNLVINIRRLNAQHIGQFRVPSDQIIEDFIIRNIHEDEADKLFLVYTGRQLDPRNSFAQQFVESESELYCLHETKDEVTGEKKQKYEKKMMSKDTSKQQDPKTFQDRDNKQINASMRLQSYKQNLHLEAQRSNHEKQNERQSLKQQQIVQSKECSFKDDSNSSMNSIPIATPHFMQFPTAPHNVNIYLIQQDNTSFEIQQKQQCQTNRQDGSGVYSNSSSRIKQQDNFNDYNFELVQKMYGNKFSRKKSQQQYNFQGQIDQIQVHSQLQSFKKIEQVKKDQKKEPENANLTDMDYRVILSTANNQLPNQHCQLRKSASNQLQSKSLNIVQLPAENRPREHSSLLVDYGSKCDFNSASSPYSQSRKQSQSQPSQIDELNKLFSKIQSNIYPSKLYNHQLATKIEYLQRYQQKLSKNENENEDGLIDTSLCKRLAKDNQQPISPICFQNIKGFPAPAFESMENHQKLSVQSSIQFSPTVKDNKHSLTISHNQIYRIGQFVYNSQPNSFDHFAYFINIIGNTKLLESYP